MFAHLAGGGESADAHHLTQPMPNGAGAGRAIVAALAGAGATPADIDLVVAHATGTPDNDAAEVAALQGVFGRRLADVPAAGLKSRLGHTLGAAGAAELILAGLAMRDGVLPTTAQTTAADHDFDPFCLADGAPRSRHPAGGGEYVAGIRRRQHVRGHPGRRGGRGHDVRSARTPRRLDHRRRRHHPRRRGPRRLRRPPGLGPHRHPRPGARRGGFGPPAKRPPRPPSVRLREADPGRRPKLALDDAGVSPDQYEDFGEHTAGLLGTTHGSTKYSYAYYRGIVDDGLHTANPMQFAEGVPNAGAAHLSMSLRLRGPCQTIIGSRTAGLDALRLAALRIRTGEWERAVVCAGEEHDPLVERCLTELGVPLVTAGGAVTSCWSRPPPPGPAARPRRPACGGGGQITAPGDPRQHRRRLSALLDPHGVHPRSRSPHRCRLCSPPPWADRATPPGFTASRPRPCVEPDRPDVTALAAGVAETFSATGLLAVAHVVDQVTTRGPRTVLTGDLHGLHTAVAIAPAPA